MRSACHIFAQVAWFYSRLSLKLTSTLLNLFSVYNNIYNNKFIKAEIEGFTCRRPKKYWLYYTGTVWLGYAVTRVRCDQGRCGLGTECLEIMKSMTIFRANSKFVVVFPIKNMICKLLVILTSVDECYQTHWVHLYTY